MKEKFFLLSILLFSFATAQKINSVTLYQNTDRFIINFSGSNANISITSAGNLLYIREKEVNNSTVYPDAAAGYSFDGDRDFDYDDLKSGFFASKGDFITFYDDFHDYEAGKLKSAGNTEIKYYDGFHAYEKGKIKSIGDLSFTYYDDFHNYKKGKIKSIGNLQFDYFDSFYPYKEGKLKSVKGNKNHIKINIIHD